jgi:outer membrane lipoprotein carrier protein
MLLNIVKKVLYLFFFLLLSTISLAQTAAEQLGNLLQRFHSMEANFTQTTFDSGGKRLQSSSGRMALQRPGKFRWSTQSPSKQLYVADGKSIWIYNSDLQQATKQRIGSARSTNPASLLSGSVESLQQRFIVTPISKSGGNAFKLTPKAKGDMFQWIQLYFADNHLSQMKLSDNMGHLSIVRFSKVKTNTSLSSGLFHFKPPRGVDVVAG